jgi:hypothetical protein
MFCQRDAKMTLANWQDVAVTTLGHHVLGVVLLRASEQVTRVGAGRVVTGVKHAGLLRGQHTAMQHERVDVCGNVRGIAPGSIGEVAVPEVTSCPEPFPAGVRGQAAQDLGPEAGVDRQTVVGPCTSVNLLAGVATERDNSTADTSAGWCDLERGRAELADEGEFRTGLASGLEQWRRLLLRHGYLQVRRGVTPGPSQAVPGIRVQCS